MAQELALLAGRGVERFYLELSDFAAAETLARFHQVNHAHWAELNENHSPVGTPEFGLVPWNQAPPIRPAVKDHA